MSNLKIFGCTLVMLFMLLSNSVYAQLNLGKKSDLKDMNSKTLMVVLENNSMVDLALKESVEKFWKLSKYEFCNLDKFNEIKGDDSYYFLIRVDGIFSKEREPGIEFISLVKGGPKGVESVGQMEEVISIPLNSSEGGMGSETSYLPIFVNIIHAHVLRVQKSKVTANIGIAWYSNNLKMLKGKDVLINREELADILSEKGAELILGDSSIKLVDEDEIESALLEGRKNCVVSLSVAPEVEQMGSYCYKMLMSTDTYELYYFKKQKIRTKTPKGFLESDLKAFVFPIRF